LYRWSSENICSIAAEEALRKKERGYETGFTTKAKLVEKLVWVAIISFCKISFPVTHLMPYYSKTGHYHLAPPNRLTLPLTLLGQVWAKISCPNLSPMWKAFFPYGPSHQTMMKFLFQWFLPYKWEGLQMGSLVPSSFWDVKADINLPLSWHQLDLSRCVPSTFSTPAWPLGLGALGLGPFHPTLSKKGPRWGALLLLGPKFRIN
jgi:hypothetical protein